MTQINFHTSPEFQKCLKRYMSLKGVTNKSEAIRCAVEDAVRYLTKNGSRPIQKKKKPSDCIGIFSDSQHKKKRIFSSDDDLWS